MSKNGTRRAVAATESAGIAKSVFERNPYLLASAKTGLIGLQLGLLVIAVRQFEIISAAFLDLCILTFFGFLVHAHLPRRYQLPFFVVLSVGALVVIMGSVNAIWLMGMGLGLIGLSHLPVGFWFRVGLLVAAGAGLGLVRTSGEAAIVPPAVLPILASMFMFRMIVYLYDLRSEKPGTSSLWPVSYFFLLPNVVFPLFPLVDYKQFRSTYFNEDPHVIYQRGIHWIFRGIYHLLLYRLVYLYLTIDPETASGTADLVQYSVASFLLYLRVSGTFHLAVGLLLLFGFNLPETHHHYYIASSFTDFWRRINIYWKEFMRRIVFFPANFRLRRLGARSGLALSTALVFLATWFLHSYQWFWLTGYWLFELHDAMFWGILALLVIVNVLYDDWRGAEATWGKGSLTNLAMTALLCRTVATFTIMAILWGMWSSDSLAQWLSMWAGTGNLWIGTGAVVTALYVASHLLQDLDKARAGRAPVPRPKKPPPPPLWRTAAPTMVGVLLLLIITWPGVYERFTDRWAGVVESVRSSQLNERDRKKLEKGYYEHLMSLNVTSGLWELYTHQPQTGIQDTTAWRATNNALGGELMPGSRLVFKGAQLTVNSHGMRDREYSVAKPEGTVRIALLGTSHVMGSGVADGETFDAVLEDRLNGRRPGHYELLNFGVGSYGTLQYLYQLEHKVAPFRPDIVMAVGHPHDMDILVRSLTKLIREGKPIPYPEVQEMLRRAGIGPDTPEGLIERRLQPILDNLQTWIYQQIAKVVVGQGARPVWAILPVTDERQSPGQIEAQLTQLRTAGFTTISLAGVYTGQDPEIIRISEWDGHPTAVGHRLVADRLYQELQREGLL